MPRPRAVDQAQMGFDETQISDAPLEQALEERQSRKAVLGEARKDYKEAHEAASAEIAKLELPDGKVIRVGRFRISRSAVSGRSVSFDTKATSRIRITLLDADEAAVETAGNGADYPDRPPKRPDPTHIDSLRNLAADARQVAP